MEMKDKLFSFVLAVIVVQVASIAMAKEARDEYLTLKRRIVIYNLVNGLYLDRRQVHFILSRAENLRDIKQRLEERSEQVIAEQKGLLLELEEGLRKGSVPGGLGRRIHTTNTELSQMKREYIKAVKETVDEVKEVLSPSQIYLIDNFRPCLIPPEGPQRIGQNTLSSASAGLLARIRGMSEEEYVRKKYKIIDSLLERIALKKPSLGEAELSRIENKIGEVLDRSRSLSDVDFALQKDSLAAEIKEAVGHTGSKSRGVLDKKIAVFLLSEEAIPVLKEEVARLSK